MLLSVLIVNWNTTGLLTQCLKSVYRECNAGRLADSQIIVVDNASEDFSLEDLRAQFPEVVFIRNERNEGYARGNNQAIECACGKYFLLLNPDTELTPGSLDVLIDFMEAHPETGAAGAKLVRPNGELDHSCRGFPAPLSLAFEYFFISRLFPKSKLFGAYRMDWFGYDRIMEVDQPMASCLIARKTVFDQVGGFDERFPIFFNDVDWCFRVKKAGWKIHFIPNAVVVHHGAASTRQVKEKMIEESHRSLAEYYRKHYSGWANLPARALVGLGVWLNRHLLHRRGRELK